jgi:hypothetical protein
MKTVMKRNTLPSHRPVKKQYQRVGNIEAAFFMKSVGPLTCESSDIVLLISFP